MARDLHQTRAAGDHDDEQPEPPQIRRFRRLVSALMVVMMVGILSIAGALVWRLTQGDSANSIAPVADEITVPQGVNVLSVSRAGNSLYILLKNSETGALSLEERDAGNQRPLKAYSLVPEARD